MTSLIRHIKSELNCYFLLHMYEVNLIVSNTIRTTEPRKRPDIYLATSSFPNISVVCVCVCVYVIYKPLVQRGHGYLFFSVFSSHTFVSFPGVFCVIFTSYFSYLFFIPLFFLLSFVSFFLTKFVSVR
jgi:hypothetical protein